MMWRLLLVLSVLALVAPAPVPFRYISANVGGFYNGCWRHKLCHPEVVEAIQQFIADWQPDMLLLTEMTRQDQLMGTAVGGPVLPPGYTGVCGKSINRFTGQVTTYDDDNGSGEHDCVAWKTSRLSLVPGSEHSVPGRNDSAKAVSDCQYFCTSFRVQLVLDGTLPITGVIVHPDAFHDWCREYEIKQYWEQQPGPAGTCSFVGGDWNAGKMCALDSSHLCFDNASSTAVLQVPASFDVEYSNGEHYNYGKVEYDPTWTGAFLVDNFYDAFYDHVFATGGLCGVPCPHCGALYGTVDIPGGVAVGGYDGMPRMCGSGSGCDHHQVMLDKLLALR